MITLVPGTFEVRNTDTHWRGRDHLGHVAGEYAYIVSQLQYWSHISTEDAIEFLVHQRRFIRKEVKYLQARVNEHNHNIDRYVGPPHYGDEYWVRCATAERKARTKVIDRLLATQEVLREINRALRYARSLPKPCSHCGHVEES